MSTTYTTSLPAADVNAFAAGDTFRVVRRTVRPGVDGFWDVEIEIERLEPEPRISWTDMLRVRFLLGIIRFRGRTGL